MKLPTLHLRPKTPTSRKRRGNRSRVVRWVMWSPQRAKRVFVVTIAVVALGGVFGVSWWNYQRQVAAWQASQAAKTAEAATPTVTSKPGDGMTALAAESKARMFLMLWLGGRTQADTKVWVASLAPYATPRLLALVKDTERSSIPDATVTDVSGPVDETAAPLLVVLSDKTRLSVTVERANTAAPWLVTDFRPAGT